MGRAPCCEKVGLKRGRWTAEEDEILASYIAKHGEGSWRSLPKNAGLLRCGKSCRLRWINYLRADVKRGNISKEEENVIIKLHATLGNRWSLIASHLPGRTDNEIKNYWNSHLSRQIHTYRRTYTAGPDTTITIDISKLHSAEKRRGGRAPGGRKVAATSSGKEEEHHPAERGPGEPESPEAGGASSSPAAAAAAAASSPPQSDGAARSGVVDPDQAQASSAGGPCSEGASGPLVLDPIELDGLWEAESGEMEALLSSADDIGLDFVGQGHVDDLLLDMDWDGFAADLWGHPEMAQPHLDYQSAGLQAQDDRSAVLQDQIDQAALIQAHEDQCAVLRAQDDDRRTPAQASTMLQAAEPQCDPDELESFAMWLLSD